MKELKLKEKIILHRHKANITQDQLANHMGVSKSSISKWETGNSYPDIELLPKLATLFNISVDELIGYEPQLSQSTINRIYHELADEMAEDPLVALQHCEEYVKKYYACFPFLYQVALLYLNHCFLFEDKMMLLMKAKELCQRIQKESDDSILIKDSVSLEAIISTLTNHPEETLALLGEEIRPFSQDSELIAFSFQQLGNAEKANEILQVCMYQHLIYLIQDTNTLIMMRLDYPEFCKQSLERLFAVANAYQMDDLHMITAIQLYLAAASVYIKLHDTDNALTMIEHYTRVILNSDIQHLVIHGDAYFTQIADWLKEQKIDPKAPIGTATMKESVIATLTSNPIFDDIQEEFRFRTCVEKLEKL